MKSIFDPHDLHDLSQGFVFFHVKSFYRITILYPLRGSGPLARFEVSLRHMDLVGDRSRKEISGATGYFELHISSCRFCGRKLLSGDFTGR